MEKDTMLGKMMGKIVGLPSEIIGVLYDLVEKLASGDWQEWLTELKKFLRKEKCWVAETILELIGTVTISARNGRFVARDYFIKDTSKKAKMKISYLGDNLKENFLSKVEEAIAKTTLRYHRLRKDLYDKEILTNLGGKNKAETMLAEMFGLMEMQPNGESGTLLTNGYANIFYIKDVNGVLWAVSCYWDDDGWYVNALSVESPSRWRGGNQVFSRNSLDS